MTNERNKETPYDFKSFGRLKVIGYQKRSIYSRANKGVLYMRQRLSLVVYIIYQTYI